MKSGIHTVLVLSAVLGWQATLSAATPTVTLNASTITPAVNSQFTVTMSLSGASPFANWAAFLRFDGAKLALVSQATGSFSTFIQDGRTLADINTSGQVRAGGFGLSNNAGGTGTLGVFTFKVLAAGATTISTENKSSGNPFGNVLQASGGGEVLPTIAGALTVTGNGTPSFTLTVNKIGSGSGTVALSPAGGTYTQGTVVTLAASSSAGSVFAGWSGDLSGSTTPTTITMTANKTVTATFNTTPPPSFTLNVSTAGTGTGTVGLNPPGGTYAQGTVVTITATPTGGSTFDNWSGDASGSANPTTITMSANRSVVANMSAPVTANRPPVISSPLSFAPFVPAPAEQVTFTVGASDPDGQTLTITYSYGDGFSDTTGQHAYAVDGTYVATASVSDGVAVVTSSVQVVVVSGGSGGNGGAGGIPPGTGKPLTITKKSVRAKNPSAGSDTLSFAANLELPASETDLNADFIVKIGSADAYTVTMTKGKAKTGKSSFSIKAKSKKGVLLSRNVTLTAKCANRDFLKVLADAGLPAGSSGSVTAKATVVYEGTLYTGDLVLNVKGSAKSATGK